MSRMKDDTISRQAAINALYHVDEYNGRSIEAIRNLPSTKQHGKWEHVVKKLMRGGHIDASRCSVCHKIIMPHLKPNYCPNCGAKMDDEEK